MFVGKFVLDDEMSWQVGIFFCNYFKEVMFYCELQQCVMICMFDCYYVEIEGEGLVFVLIFGDMYFVEQGNQIVGCSFVVVCVVVFEFLGLYVLLWNDFLIFGVDWIGEFEFEFIQENVECYEMFLFGFFECFGVDFIDGQIDVLSKFVGVQLLVMMLMCEFFSFVYIDYCFDNLLIDEWVDVLVVIVVDWQSIIVGNLLIDVVYFFGVGLCFEECCDCEEEIVWVYYDCIVVVGVVNYSWVDCWIDYCCGVYFGFWVMVIVLMFVQEIECGNEMFLMMVWCYF